jgi:hypothetical protein
MYTPDNSINTYMTSGSPTLSTTTRSSKPRTSSNSNSSAIANFNYQELFEDVDWNEVNLIDIEREWRNELDQIEKVPLAPSPLYYLMTLFFRPQH